ncbi:complex I assembly factor TIMMDC1, mitochondrial isoform X2 [Myotis daubentonii]|uniref:complex I assembly factor TIMMDC1, mitochondrial isoform X2 n=1 Tax=Myotis daubentonii TaxID=98922 RepID=UPI0028735FEC|nr:complex I assembly factor TIMMDC1, mitochondrial isoform X2 [Myotis daubentonii]
MVRTRDAEKFAARHRRSPSRSCSSPGCPPTASPRGPITKLVTVRRLGDGHGAAAAGAEEHPLDAGSFPSGLCCGGRGHQFCSRRPGGPCGGPEATVSIRPRTPAPGVWMGPPPGAVCQRQSAHRAATRGFIRYGWRWSWRTAVFVTIFNTVNTGLSVYRDKNALSHFIIAGAVTGSLFRINLGLPGFVAGGIIGALLGTPVGSLLMVLQKYCGETIQERKQKEKKVLQELKLEEWKARLQITELLPEEIESSLQKNQPKDDIEKIEALLNLPRNPSSADKQDKD